MNAVALVLLLGVTFGTVAALAIFLSGSAAARVGRDSALLEIAIRLGVFGVVLVGGAELVGAFFGALVRQHAAWFFGATAVSFFAVPWAFSAITKRRGSHEG